MTPENTIDPPKTTSAVQIIDRAVQIQKDLDKANHSLELPQQWKDGLGHTYILQNGSIEEVRPEKQVSRDASFGTVGALVEYLKKYGTPERSRVIVSRDGVHAVLDMEKDGRDLEVAKLPFFSADLPPAQPMPLLPLLDWVDCSAVAISGGTISLLGEKGKDGSPSHHLVKFKETHPSEKLREAFEEVSATQNAKSTIKSNGAMVIAETTNKAGGSIKSAIPAFIQVILPVGTHEYTEPFIFKLTIAPAEGELYFKLLHVGRDRAIYNWLARCVADIRAGLGKEWLVVEGA